MRFLAQASRSFSHVSPGAATPKTLRTPKTPLSPSLSPTAGRAFSFFPEERQVVPKVPAVHESLPALSGNGFGRLAQNLTFQPGPFSASKPVPSSPEAKSAAAARDAVLARRARQESRCAPPVARALGLALPSLLSHEACSNPGTPRAPQALVGMKSCAQAAQESFWAQHERRSSRGMVDFVV